MRIKMLLLCIFLGLLSIVVLSYAKPETIADFVLTDGSETVLIVIPRGDPVAGRVAFQKMSCNCCHKVVNDPSMPGTSEKSAPDLEYRKAGSSSGYEVTSILSPSHLAAFEYRTNTGTSSMPDLTRNMTVRELIDILAYLRSIKP